MKYATESEGKSDPGGMKDGEGSKDKLKKVMVKRMKKAKLKPKK